MLGNPNTVNTQALNNHYMCSSATDRQSLAQLVEKIYSRALDADFLLATGVLGKQERKNKKDISMGSYEEQCSVRHTRPCQQMR